MDPWEQRRNAIYAWYLIYWKAPLVRKCINRDVFALVLAYLDKIDLSVPLYLEGEQIYLDHSDEGYCWKLDNDVPFRTPCHTCMRPCSDYMDVLCPDHTHLTCNTGRSGRDRAWLMETIWKCECDSARIRIDTVCARRISHIILPE